MKTFTVTLTADDLVDLKLVKPQLGTLQQDFVCPKCSFSVLPDDALSARRALEVIDKILKEAK